MSLAKGVVCSLENILSSVGKSSITEKKFLSSQSKDTSGSIWSILITGQPPKKP